MPGSFDLPPVPLALSSLAPQVQVARFDGKRYTALPNVAAVRLDDQEGASPAVANFEYKLDDALSFNLGWPSQIEAIWPIDAAPNPYVVQNDDRIVILVADVNGNPSVWFDGNAQIPQADTSGVGVGVSFSAVSVAAREWDTPIRGRLQRSADDPKADPEFGPIDTDLTCRFNPSDTTTADGNKGGIIANCTPDDCDVNQDDPKKSYPVFLDEGIEAIPADGATPAVPAPQTLWTIGKACRYLMSVGNPTQNYVDLPDFSSLSSLLQSNWPAQGGDTIQKSGDQTGDIVIRDYEASDKAWPEAVAELLSYSGFAMSFLVSTNDDGTPSTEASIYRRDALTPLAPKKVYLQPAGGNVGDGLPRNASSFHLARDCNSIVNQYSIESPLKQVECSFILAPLFKIVAGDAAVGDTGREQFVRSKWTATTTAEVKRAYRWYGVDEIADGYLNTSNSKWIDDEPFDFDVLFPQDKWVKRYRPGSSTLISVDSEGSPLKADLSISFNYRFAGPGIWDGTGDWWKINGGWKVLGDRLGIEVTIDDPSQWNSGKKLGDIRGVEWWATPATSLVSYKDPGGNASDGFSPVLRLTTVISDDRMLSAIAPKRNASPTTFARRRRADARDHFQYNRVLALSMYNTTGKDVIARDDTDKAKAHAYALRQKTEFPPLAGSISLNGILTNYYELGDRISEIDGRNINLQTNVAAGQGEAPDFPFVVGRSFIFQPEIATILQLSDQRAAGGTNL